jgi:hypothetical protein
MGRHGEVTGAILQLFDVNSQRTSLKEISNAGIDWIEMNQFRVQYVLL